jgi:hypothetical protein
VEEEGNDCSSSIMQTEDDNRHIPDEICHEKENNPVSTKCKKKKVKTNQTDITKEAFVNCTGVKPPFHPINSDLKGYEHINLKPYDLYYPLYPPGTNSPLDSNWATIGDSGGQTDSGGQKDISFSENYDENQTEMSFSAFVVPTREMSTRGKAKKLRDFSNYSPFQFITDNNEIGASGASCSSTYNSNSNYDTNIKNKRNIPNSNLEYSNMNYPNSNLKNEDGNPNIKLERGQLSILDKNSGRHYIESLLSFYIGVYFFLLFAFISALFSYILSFYYIHIYI